MATADMGRSMVALRALRGIRFRRSSVGRASLVCVALLAATAAHAQCTDCTGTITFEGFNEATLIGTQYAAQGVTFGIVGSATALPRIVVSGASQLGFVGPGGANNTPLPSGTRAIAANVNQSIQINFDPPVSVARFTIIDIDTPEAAYQFRAFSGNNPIPSNPTVVVNPGRPGFPTGDGVFTLVDFSAISVGSIGDITRIEIVPPANVSDYAVDNVEYLRSRWIASGNHEYKAIPARRGTPEIPGWMTWNTAAQFAASEGGYLASITNAAENTFIYSNLVNNALMWDIISPVNQPNNVWGPWIGGVRVSDSLFAWSNDETWSYQNFKNGEPNNLASAENRVHFANNPTRTAQWNDLADTTGVTAGCIIERTLPTCLAVTRPSTTRTPRGGTATFSITATGTAPIAYRWRRETTPGVFTNLVDGPGPGGSTIAGSTTNTLIITNAGELNAGEYDCVASNSCETFACAGSATLLTPVSIGIARGMRLGRTVILGDVAISERANLVQSATSRAFTLQDSTGGVSIFGTTSVINALLNLSTEPNNVFTTLEGQTYSFKGLAELQAPFAAVAASQRRVVPRVNVIEQDFEDGSLTAEQLEARLVELPNVILREGTNPPTPFVAGRVYNTTGGAKIWMRLNAVVAAANARFGGATNFPVRFRGVFWQQEPDAGLVSPPYDAGYYLLVTDVLPGCVADFDDGTSTGRPDGGVTIDDLLYYLVIFANGAVAADVDDGSGTGTPDRGVTIDDLLYFIQRFEAGC